jgi:hypothetical protein
MADEEPRVCRVSGSLVSRQRLLFVSGFHTSDYAEPKLKLWIRAFRRAGWMGSVHWLWWDSCCSHDRFTALWDVLDWPRANREAERAGERLPSLLRGMPGRGAITLAGHSLGAKVILTGLAALEEDHALPLRDAVMLAAAVHSEADGLWAEAAARLSGRLVNVVNRRDGALGARYVVGELLRLSPGRAGGRRGAGGDEIPEGLLNLDVTGILETDSHTEVYRSRLSEVLGWLWKPQRRRAMLLAVTAAAVAGAAVTVLAHL